jgi:hypothetical protein
MRKLFAYLALALCSLPERERESKRIHEMHGLVGFHIDFRHKFDM